MVSKVHTLAFQGIEVIDVEVQVHMTTSTSPTFTVVGLADKAVGEARDRVRAAISSVGLACPLKRITVNLSPADLAKEGSHFDLAIALAILVDMEIIPEEEVSGYIALGEVTLDGRLLPVSGTLPAAVGARARGKGIICPVENGKEAAWADKDLPILAASSLLELVNHFKGLQVIQQPEHGEFSQEVMYPDLEDVKGQATAKRVLEIAAAGGHSMLMVGPPGSGKSMLATRLPGIIPPLSVEEMLEVSMVNSIAGKLKNGKLICRRPYRDPHHSCSMAAMAGGGRTAKPGEVTLAHRGVLFLDELPEFNGNVLESLRQPTESGKITVARVNAHITYPANFQLIAAMNPCRCGYLGDPERSCSRAPQCGTQYQSKISGPLFDRIDLHVEVQAVTLSDIQNSKQEEKSVVIAERVSKARQIQAERYRSYPTIIVNADSDGDVLREVMLLDQKSNTLLEHAMEKMNLSMRGYNRLLRVSRTIADLDAKEKVEQHHVAEALSYR